MYNKTKPFQARLKDFIWKKNKIESNLFLILLLAFVKSSFAQVTNIGADLIIHNALITTLYDPNPDAQAVAVKNGRVYAVGNDVDILNLADVNTEIIDGNGRRLIPGLNDNHIHFFAEGVKYNYSLRWDGVPTLAKALNMLTEQAAVTPLGQFIKVMGGWTPYQFAENRLPTMAELQSAVPNHPFYIQYSYNEGFLNQMAMDTLGVGQSWFPQYPGTTWETDSLGNLTGKVFGEPSSLMFWTLEFLVPQPTASESKNSVLQLARAMNKAGLTSITDAGSHFNHPYPPSITQHFMDNEVPLRISFLDITTSVGVDSQLYQITNVAPIGPGQNLHPHLDHGFEYEGFGEVLNFSTTDFENFDQPVYILDSAQVKQTVFDEVGQLVRHGMPFRLHATFNQLITPILDALEELNAITPFDGLKWSIEHAETISPANIQRIKELGGGIAIQNRMGFHGEAFMQNYGDSTALYAPPIKMIREAGVPLSLGTDGLRVASFNPWLSLYWATTGKTMGGVQHMAADNILSREEALRLYTLGSSWQQGEENEKGRIAPGYYGDFALLNLDYMNVADEDIRNIRSVLTVLDGEVVYGDEEYTIYSPVIPAVEPTWSPVNLYPGYFYSDQFSDTLVSLIEINNNDFDFEISPNPVSNQSSIIINSINDSEYNLEIVDIKGNIIRQKNISGVIGKVQYSIDTSDLPTGTYFFTLRNNLNNSISKKIIVH